MAVAAPTYTLTDKDLTEMESQTRAALENLTALAPEDRRTGKKVPLPGIKAAFRLLDMYASIRASYAKVAPMNPADELDKQQEDLRKNLEWMESHRLDPKTNQAAKDSVRKGIVRIEARIKELNEILGATSSEVAEPVAF